MGLNFSIVIGAIAGQLGVIMAVNWELSRILGFLTAALFATLFAVLFGILTGMMLNKARGHEMIASLFVGYLGNGIYNFIVLALIGSVIPITSAELLLGDGVGLKNTINLKGTLLHSVDGLLQVQFFLLLIIVGILFLGFTIYHLMKKDAHLDKKIGYARIALFTVVILMSSLIMYGDVLPKEIKQLKNIEFPVITGVLICAIAVFSLMITRTKIGQDFTQLSSNQQRPIDPDRLISKVRITAIAISTIVAAWGQIILLQNTGVLSTYGSHMGTGVLAVSALVVGGATIKQFLNISGSEAIRKKTATRQYSSFLMNYKSKTNYYFVAAMTIYMNVPSHFVFILFPIRRIF
ncbi:hypothetical protein [Clostridium tagluense]|uniref:hypothetical protein n=1 Tax=Clostridium tagluense TaxID=360422 RepID=UPI001C0B3D82|nr:hypothetical protein [Clostridium tagluense]MBU3128978.1 hypothetical protein [Clostridium tagluense]